MRPALLRLITVCCLLATISAGAGAVPPASAATPGPGCTWAGEWNTVWPSGSAVMTLDETGSGSYVGTLSGTVRGKLVGDVLAGTWEDEAGSGVFEFVLGDDCRSFTGRYRFAGQIAWRTWNGLKLRPTVTLELRDPYPELTTGEAVTLDDERRATASKAVVAVAADGVARVLVRAFVPGEGLGRFCLAGGIAPADGGFIDGGGAPIDCATIRARPTSRGQLVSALYQAPDDFSRGPADHSRRERRVTITLTFTPDGGGEAVQGRQELRIVRPPLVLVHGLWSYPATWTFPLVTNELYRDNLSLVNYEESNAAYFDYNQRVVYTEGGIEEALERARQNGVAVAQADVVGHSMGGILARLYARTRAHRRAENYGQGDINRLITLNTPHAGSPLANLAVFLRDITAEFSEDMRQVGKPVYPGAIDDLITTSRALPGRYVTDLPGHAVAGIGAVPSPQLGGDFYRVLSFYAEEAVAKAFAGFENDGVVTRRSQEGGLPESATSSMRGIESGHLMNTSSPQYAARVLELLNAPVESETFAPFPVMPDLPEPPLGARAQPSEEQAPPAPLAAGGLTIAAPADGAVARPGGTVRVVVTPPPGAVVSEVLVAGRDTAEIDRAAPFELDLPVPDDAVGTLTISAVGKTPEGGFVRSNSVTLSAVPAAALEELILAQPSAILFGAGDSRSLPLLGRYADGVVRQLRGAEASVVYTSSDPAVVLVAADGRLTAVGPGTADVEASVGGLSATVSVRVLAMEDVPVAEAGPDQVVPVGGAVWLSAVGSSDPAPGPEPLAYEWFQVGGPPVELADPLSASPAFVAARPGVYAFSLLVSDGLRWSRGDVVRVTVTKTNHRVWLPMIVRR